MEWARVQPTRARRKKKAYIAGKPRERRSFGYSQNERTCVGMPFFAPRRVRLENVRTLETVDIHKLPCRCMQTRRYQVLPWGSTLLQTWLHGIFLLCIHSESCLLLRIQTHFNQFCLNGIETRHFWRFLVPRAGFLEYLYSTHINSTSDFLTKWRFFAKYDFFCKICTNKNCQKQKKDSWNLGNIYSTYRNTTFLHTTNRNRWYQSVEKKSPN